jgi:hypothetical protein
MFQPQRIPRNAKTLPARGFSNGPWRDRTSNLGIKSPVPFVIPSVLGPASTGEVLSDHVRFGEFVTHRYPLAFDQGAERVGLITTVAMVDVTHRGLHVGVPHP